MKNNVTQMFGCDIPIFAFSHCRDVVAEVTRAGGVGVLGAVSHSPQALETDLAWIEERVGAKPYGVDLIVPADYAGADVGGSDFSAVAKLIPPQHRSFLAELLERYDVPEMVEDAGRGQFRVVDGEPLPMTANAATPQLDIALEFSPALIVNALGPPPRAMIDAAKERGRKVGALAGKASHAQRHVDCGVDLLIAQGYEAGGHTGEIGSMVLIPEVVDVAGDIPVLGAGGIGRGRQMAAAMALGAQGVWCGSVWLTTDEAETHPVVKQKFMAASSSDTVRSASRTGKPARQLKSAWTKEWESASNPSPLGMPMQPMLVNDALARIGRGAHQAGSGSEQLVNYFVGQIVGSMNGPITTAQVVFDMVDEFVSSVEGLHTQLRS